MSRLPAPENRPLPDIVVPDADIKISDEEVEGISPVSDIPVTAPVLDNEPIVTRKELWSYYVCFTIFSQYAFIPTPQIDVLQWR